MAFCNSRFPSLLLLRIAYFNHKLQSTDTCFLILFTFSFNEWHFVHLINLFLMLFISRKRNLFRFNLCKNINLTIGDSFGVPVDWYALWYSLNMCIISLVFLIWMIAVVITLFYNIIGGEDTQEIELQCFDWRYTWLQFYYSLDSSPHTPPHLFFFYFFFILYCLGFCGWIFWLFM